MLAQGTPNEPIGNLYPKSTDSKRTEGLSLSSHYHSPSPIHHSKHLPLQLSTWDFRDGRRPSTTIKRETESFIREHLDYLSRKKTLNVEALENLEFSVSFISEQSNTKKEIDLPKEPLKKFKSLGNIPEQLSKNIQTLHFELMTPIQRAVVPYMREGNDIMGCSETGSGKTIAYLFPLVSKMIVNGPPITQQQQNDKMKKAFPVSLILVPTRELADQVFKESKKMCYDTGINTVKIYGGVPYDSQLNKLSMGCDILVATPGRLIDYLKTEVLSLKMVTTIILDEADRMLDMGFEEQLNTIFFNFDLINKEQRQNLMFSATFSSEVRGIARKFMRDFYFIQPKNIAPKQIRQEVIKASDYEKKDTLSDILSKIKGSAIIFTDTKKRVDLLSDFLKSRNIRVCAIHGDKKQFQRQAAIEKFTNGYIPLLIATDVASRGLDFPNVNYVINYDLPKNLDDYIHRIGRTGRLGQEGTAISLINPENEPILKKLYSFLKSQGQEIPNWLHEMYINEIEDDKKRKFTNKTYGYRTNNSFQNYQRVRTHFTSNHNDFTMRSYKETDYRKEMEREGGKDIYHYNDKLGRNGYKEHYEGKRIEYNNRESQRSREHGDNRKRHHHHKSHHHSHRSKSISRSRGRSRSHERSREKHKRYHSRSRSGSLRKDNGNGYSYKYSLNK